MEDYEIFGKLEKIIYGCVDKIWENDSDLFEKSEWAITFRLGYYLQRALEIEKSIVLKSYVVDSEYNRFEDDPKKAFKECEECEKRKSCLGDVEYNKGIRPDLMIHIRGKNDEYSNLMVIEVKKLKSNKNDYDKLKYLTCKRAKYQYQIGAHVVFDKTKNKSEFKWFENGEVERA